MNLNTFVSLTVNGIAMGMVYALMAMGLILLIRAVGVMNFAQGDLLMFGAYIACALIVDFKMPLSGMIPVALICFALLGVIFMFSVYWPLRNATYPAATVISTMGAAMVLKEVASLIWGSLPRLMPPLVKNPATGRAALLKIGGVTLHLQFALTIIVAAVLIALVFLLFEKLYAGRMMQAAAQNKYAAELLGIPTILTTMATYIIVVIMASIGGFMISTHLYGQQDFGHAAAAGLCRGSYRWFRQHQGCHPRFPPGWSGGILQHAAFFTVQGCRSVHHSHLDAVDQTPGVVR